MRDNTSNYFIYFKIVLNNSPRRQLKNGLINRLFSIEVLIRNIVLNGVLIKKLETKK